MKKLRKRWASLSDAARVRVLIMVALLSMAILTSGFALAMSRDWTGLLLNFGTELLGAFVTFLLLDTILASRDEQESRQKRTDELRQRLIHKLGSAINSEARRAAEELRALGWLTDGTLNDIELINANLEGVDLRGAKLVGARLYRANLRNAKLFDADLSKSVMTAADLSNASCRRLKLDGATINGVKFEGAKQLGRQTLACAHRLKGAIMPDGKRYNGCFCLDGDLSQFEKHCEKIKADGDFPGVAALWYNVEEEEYIQGQKWAQSYLTRVKAGELEEETTLLVDSMTSN